MTERPRFCPRCQKSRAPSERDLCTTCGDQLALQGYCGVCDRYWKLPEGDPCPKHDLALERPPTRTLPEPAPIGKWVTVVTCGHPFAAEARRLRLEAEGIPTFLADSRMGTDALYQVATGGIKVQVPVGLVDDARILLAQSWAIPPMDDLDEAWEELEPESSNLFNEIATRLIQAVVLLVLGLLLVLGYLESLR